MEAFEAIISRRSIRKYTSQEVPQEVLEGLLKAAMSAPSASNEQPWYFIVIKDRKILNKIPKFHRYSSMLIEAPIAILVCGDLNELKSSGFWVQDCSAATQNILVAANAKGLGAVWLGVYPRERRVNGLRRLLGIPENVVPFSLISIGYPAEKKMPANRFDTSRIHYDRWSL